ncbi:MAG: tryptophan synthase subunit alpha, partial [Deltaproteobacteria bacterium]|nr:tryptophan synthase subunit alpha [Deltaproteobacteria bacterium]
MNRIDRTFEELKRKGEKALVGFVTAGDPDMQASFDIVVSMCRAGIDVLELGIPFSDPTADGPIIQRSSAR